MLTKEQFLKDAVNLHIRTETEEIFWKVVDKLIELGFKPYANNTRDALWFAKYIFLYTSDASIHPRPNPDGKKEIQVSDILGSDYDIDKSQFEARKWYKILNKWWGKFETIHNSGKRIKFSETITSNGKYINASNHIDFISEIELLTDLSEIQQYLPDGHPDKIDESEKADICETCNGEGTVMTAKLYPNGHTEVIEDCPDCNGLGYIEKESKLLIINDLVEGEVYTDEDCIFIAPNDSTKGLRISTKSIVKNNQFDLNNSELRLATPEEKQWLNVCISESKFIEKEVALRDYDMYGKALKSEIIEKEIKQQFKVGDWVYADRQSDGDFRYELGDSYIPIFKVEEIYKSINTGEWLRPIKNKANGIESKYCRLATPEEIAKVTKPVEKSFEFNKWYKPDNSDGLFFIKSKNTGYGFRSNHANYWFTNNKDFEWNIDGLEPATDSEVKERLLNYTKEKYPLGTKFKCMIYNKEFTVTNPNYMDMFDELETIWVGVKEQYSGKIFDSDGKWAEIISTPVTKELQLSDLKNPVFNVGDKVRVIADSLKEFNSSWGWGNNSTHIKGYEGLITKIKETKSCFEEINTWYYLDNNSNGISCNLLELVEPVKKEFDRNWYVEVNSQEEADKVFDWLEAQGENTFRGHACFNKTFKYIRQWNNASSEYHNKWFLSSEKNNKPQKQLSDILPEYKQPIKTEEELSHIIDTNEDLRNEIQGLINQRDFKSSDFAQPIIIKSKKQKRNKLIIVNN